MSDVLYGAYTLGLGLLFLVFRDFFIGVINRINRRFWGSAYGTEQDKVARTLVSMVGALFLLVGMFTLLGTLR